MCVCVCVCVCVCLFLGCCFLGLLSFVLEGRRLVFLCVSCVCLFFFFFFLT